MALAFGPQVGRSREGYPVHRYTDPRTNRETYVVILPDRRVYFSDANGRLVATPIDASSPIAGALVGGLVGFLGGGPVGALVGALAGAIVVDKLTKGSS